MLGRLFQRKPKHERLQEEPEVGPAKGMLITETEMEYTYVRPGGKDNLKDLSYVCVPNGTLFLIEWPGPGHT